MVGRNCTWDVIAESNGSISEGGSVGDEQSVAALALGVVGGMRGYMTSNCAALSKALLLRLQMNKTLNLRYFQRY